MSIQPQDITGGKSVYCFNQQQLDGAFRLFASEQEPGVRLREEVARIEAAYTRNERAALAFVLIDRLSKTLDEGQA